MVKRQDSEKQAVDHPFSLWQSEIPPIATRQHSRLW
jgi:hypothetical protein